VSAERTGLWHRLYHGETSFDFARRWRRWFLVSGLVIVVGLVSLVTRGFNLGIDFRGGTSWEVKAPGVSVAEARDALRPEGLGTAKIQVLGADTLRVQADLGKGDDAAAKAERVKSRLARLAGGREVSVNTVGPTWGKDVTAKAQRALVFFFVVIAVYISARFEWKMAVAALAALVHDIAVTVGVYSLSGFEVTPATVVAFLTILGYSLYDTIVVFDKVQENTRGLAASGRLTYTETVNLSVNQVLMRSLNTSVTALLPVVSMLMVGVYGLGATTLQDFGLALFIGIVTSTYSSLFVASPLLALLKEREPRYRTIRQRLAAKGTIGPLTPAAARSLATEAAGGSDLGILRPAAAGTGPAPRPGGRPGQIAPRGRRPRGHKR
jgi:preprotein translocase subunit SecF